MLVSQVPDIPRIYTAISEWLACTLYVLMMHQKRTKLPKPVISAVALLGQCFWLIVSADFPIMLWIPSMVMAVFLMLLYIDGCCHISHKDSAYFTIRAFVLAEMLASLEWQIHCFIMAKISFLWWGKFLLVVLVYGTVLTLIYFLEHRLMPADMHLGITSKELWSALVIGVIIFTFSNISYVYANTPFSAQYPLDILIIRTMADIGGFAVLYTHYVICCQNRAWREVEALKSVLQNQYVQYRLSRESINLINQKYHDLKHQIQTLRAEKDPEKKSAYLDEMENDIQMYEAQYKTGNVVLDTVLTSKAMYCQKHRITFTCVVDGTLLDKMDVMDLCSVFGNALDNAIEYEKRIPDKQKRLIHVTVSQQKQFVLCRFENYYEGEQLKLEDGLPKTTKPDVAYHGYGLKSIRSVVQKYEGTVTVRTDRNWFELKVLLPMQESSN